MRRPSLTILSLLIAGTIFFFLAVSPDSTQRVKETSKKVYNTYKETTIDDLSDFINRKDSNAKYVPEKAAQLASGKSSSDPFNKEKEKVLAQGKPIMAKMSNQTLRAELGRAGWKVFHTILAQYPDKPTKDERETLETYIHMFSRVYPCRECAEHFQAMLEKYPPQTSSKEAASQWGCHVHNIVNKRLGKEIFDCMDISNKYACGCEDEDGENKDNANTKEKSTTNTNTNKNLQGVKIDKVKGKTGG